MLHRECQVEFVCRRLERYNYQQLSRHRHHPTKLSKSHIDVFPALSWKWNHLRLSFFRPNNPCLCSWYDSIMISTAKLNFVCLFNSVKWCHTFSKLPILWVRTNRETGVISSPTVSVLFEKALDWMRINQHRTAQNNTFEEWIVQSFSARRLLKQWIEMAPWKVRIWLPPIEIAVFVSLINSILD